MTTYWIDLGQLGISIRMLGHETMPGYKKKNQNKLWSLIPNKSNVEGWNLKKKYQIKLLESTWVNMSNTHPRLWDWA